MQESYPAGGAADAGLRIGDIIDSMGDERVTDSRTLDRAAALSIGTTMKLRVWSNGQTRTVPVLVKEYPQETWTSYKNEKATELVFNKISDAGFEVADLNDELRARFHLNNTGESPVMTMVADNTAASGANLRPGDVIRKVQMNDVSSRAELARRLKSLSDSGQRDALLFVEGSNEARWVTVPLRL